MCKLHSNKYCQRIAAMELKLPGPQFEPATVRDGPDALQAKD
jgi:hypothetical protein